MPFVCIDSVAPLLCKDYSQQLIQPDSFVVDCTNATPPHRIIYDSLPNKPDHYQKMAAYLNSLVNKSPLLLGGQGSTNSMKGDLKSVREMICNHSHVRFSDFLYCLNL